jgi:hypothetical protein
MATGRQGFINNHAVYVYQETGATVSAAVGVDAFDSKWKVQILASSPPWADFSGTSQFVIDPAAAGNITLTPNGAGKVVCAYMAAGAVVSSSAGNLSSTGAGSAGQLLVAAGGATAPSWTTATYPTTVAKGDVLVASADNVIGVQNGAVTAGWVLTANGANTVPTFQAASGGGIGTLAGDSGTATGATVTIAGAGGITTSAAGSTVTITGSGGGITWDRKTTTPITMVAANGYVQANAGAGLTTFVMPATAALGTVIEVIGESSGGWTITHAVGTNQLIQYGSVATTTTTGSLSSSNRYDSVKLVCRVADTVWSVVSAIGVLNVL